MTRRVWAALVGLAVMAAGGMARAQPMAAWPDTPVGRIQALAVMQTLNATLLAARSATFTIEAWCADHAMAPEPRIRARLLREIDKPTTAEQRRRLQVGPDELVKYRRVQLSCGDRILSEADNWYVPGRLTAEMNRLLETTDTPFGRAVQDLKPFRQTFAAEVLWSPLPAGWDRPGAQLPPSRPGAVLEIPDHLFSHRAVLFADGVPFSEVAETYTSQVLNFTPASIH